MKRDDAKNDNHIWYDKDECDHDWSEWSKVEFECWSSRNISERRCKKCGKIDTDPGDDWQHDISFS